MKGNTMTETNLHPYVNVANCEKLAVYLENLPEDYEDFGMVAYIQPRDLDALRKYALENGGVHSCGTAACAIGHGPAAGVYFPDPKEDDALWRLTYGTTFSEDGRMEHTDDKVLSPDWSTYSRRYFINPMSDTGQVLWDWCFGSGWAHTDDTPHGAAKRIRYMLDRLGQENPVPEFEGKKFEDMGLSYSESYAQFYLDLYQ
tara:strand:- start:1177 stop:1779 length:603 start_codon:yes stop_codon:yes gene_type:complete